MKNEKLIMKNGELRADNGELYCEQTPKEWNYYSKQCNVLIINPERVTP